MAGFVVMHITQEDYDAEIRNKAIDDFSEAVKELIVDLSVIRFKDIDEIVEQLKAGGENEQSI